MTDKRNADGTFAEGNSFGEGRQSVPKWIRERTKLTATQFLSSLEQFTSMSGNEIKELSKDESLPIAHLIMANWLWEAVHDDKSRQSLLDRMFGKPKEAQDNEEKPAKVITLAYKTLPGGGEK